jgi:hypothetical protein
VASTSPGAVIARGGAVKAGPSVDPSGRTEKAKHEERLPRYVSV